MDGEERYYELSSHAEKYAAAPVMKGDITGDGFKWTTVQFVKDGKIHHVVNGQTKDMGSAPGSVLKSIKISLASKAGVPHHAFDVVISITINTSKCCKEGEFKW